MTKEIGDMAQQTCDLELVRAALKLLSCMCSPCATEAEKVVFLIRSKTGKLAVCITVCITWRFSG